jgi:hypothetical protein
LNSSFKNILSITDTVCAILLAVLFIFNVSKIVGHF